MTTALKVLLVGQNDESLAPLHRALTSDELEIAGTSALGPAALTWARIVNPDLVVVVADDGVARPVSTIQTLAHSNPEWTIVAVAEKFEPELVRQAMLAGARDVLLRTSNPLELRQALVTARRADAARRAPGAHQSPHGAGTVITLAGVKGGIGKTTIAVNLALFLAMDTARSVALVDLDLPYGDLAMLLNLKPTGSIVTAVSDPTILADPDLLQAQLCSGPGGVHVLTAPINGTGEVVEGAQVAPLLTRLAGLYDFVVVDTPPGFVELTAAALDVASQTLLVTTPEPTTLRRTELALRQLSDWKYPGTRLKIVVNRASMRGGLRAEEIENLLSEPVAWWLPDEPRALEAATRGEPTALSQPKSELGRSLRGIAHELSGVPQQQGRSPLRFWRSRPALMTAKAY
jgi:pilus assembly protein CpaE